MDAERRARDQARADEKARKDAERKQLEKDASQKQTKVFASGADDYDDQSLPPPQLSQHVSAPVVQTMADDNNNAPKDNYSEMN